MSQPILCVCADPGGTHGLLPVYQALKAANQPTQLLTVGWAAKNLACSDGETFASVTEVLARYPKPAALVTSMCSGSDTLGRDLVPVLDRKCPTIGLQDYWGGGLWTTWADEQFRPGYLVVNDQIGQDIVKKAWLGFAPNNIMALGYPALDSLANVNCVQARTKVQAALGLQPLNALIILFAGQLEGTAHNLSQVISAINNLSHRYGSINFIPRLHPRLAKHAPAEYQRLNYAVHSIRVGDTTLPWTDVVDTQTLIAAADVVIAESSTVLVTAAALQRTPIAFLDQLGAKRYQQTYPGVAEFPLVSLGCCTKAATVFELTGQIAAGLDGTLGRQLRENQAEHFRLDGKNAERVATFVVSLL